MKNKKFDCVAMKRACQEKAYARTQGMTIEEEVAYYRKAGDELRRRIAQARKNLPKK